MPARPLRPCPAPGCSELVVKGRCAAHAVQPDARVGRRKKYDKAAWRGPHGLRLRKLRANPLCEDCAERALVVAAEHVDHSDGDADNDAWNNLRSLCAPCHSRKTATQDGGFGRERPGGRRDEFSDVRGNDHCPKGILASPKREAA